MDEYKTGDEVIALNKMTQSHERAIKKENHGHEEEMQRIANEHAVQEQSKELGWLGSIFGGEKHASKNITALINICMLVGATIVSLCVYFNDQDKGFVKAMWAGILPIVTLSLGYLFGKK